MSMTPTRLSRSSIDPNEVAGAKDGASIRSARCEMVLAPGREKRCYLALATASRQQNLSDFESLSQTVSLAHRWAAPGCSGRRPGLVQLAPQGSDGQVTQSRRQAHLFAGKSQSARVHS